MTNDTSNTEDIFELRIQNALLRLSHPKKTRRVNRQNFWHNIWPKEKYERHRQSPWWVWCIVCLTYNKVFPSFYFTKGQTCSEGLSTSMKNILKKEYYLPMILQTRVWSPKYINNSYDSTPGRQTIQLKNGQSVWTGTSPRRSCKEPIDRWKDAQHHQPPERCKLKP